MKRTHIRLSTKIVVGLALAWWLSVLLLWLPFGPSVFREYVGPLAWILFLLLPLAVAGAVAYRIVAAAFGAARGRFARRRHA